MEHGGHIQLDEPCPRCAVVLLGDLPTYEANRYFQCPHCGKGLVYLDSAFARFRVGASYGVGMVMLWGLAFLGGFFANILIQRLLYTERSPWVLLVLVAVCSLILVRWGWSLGRQLWRVLQGRKTFSAVDLTQGRYSIEFIPTQVSLTRKIRRKRRSLNHVEPGALTETTAPEDDGKLTIREE